MYMDVSLGDYAINIGLPIVTINKDCKPIIFKPFFLYQYCKRYHNYLIFESNKQGKYLYNVTIIVHLHFMVMFHFKGSFPSYISKFKLSSIELLRIHII